MLHDPILRYFLSFAICSMMNLVIYFISFSANSSALIHDYTSEHFMISTVTFYICSIPRLSYKATIKSMYEKYRTSVKHLHLLLAVATLLTSTCFHIPPPLRSQSAFTSGSVFSFYSLASSVLFNCVFSVADPSSFPWLCL
jgi:hypothetical protein